MTQEELDALMNGDFDLEALEAEEETTDNDAHEAQDDDLTFDEANYKVDSSKAWPPPPPSKEHQVVGQLDEVTKESEEKASELFDLLDTISATASQAGSTVGKVEKILAEQEAMFAKLADRFPAIALFDEHRQKTAQSRQNVSEVSDSLVSIEDSVLMAMDMMQYQDIHRQKIERVINAMRALSNYMNKLFEGKVEDTKRVSSAKHIVGDENNDVVDEDDIEALIAAFGNK